MKKIIEAVVKKIEPTAIIEAIEEELESKDAKIFLQEYEITELKNKLAEAEKTIEAQAAELADLKGANV